MPCQGQGQQPSEWAPVPAAGGGRRSRKWDVGAVCPRGQLKAWLSSRAEASMFAVGLLGASNTFLRAGEADLKEIGRCKGGFAGGENADRFY